MLPNGTNAARIKSSFASSGIPPTYTTRFEDNAAEVATVGSMADNPKHNTAEFLIVEIVLKFGT